LSVSNILAFALYPVSYYLLQLLGLMVTRLIRSTKLLYVGPGWYFDG